MHNSDTGKLPPCTGWVAVNGTTAPQNFFVIVDGDGADVEVRLGEPEGGTRPSSAAAPGPTPRPPFGRGNGGGGKGGGAGGGWPAQRAWDAGRDDSSGQRWPRWNNWGQGSQRGAYGQGDPGSRVATRNLTEIGTVRNHSGNETRPAFRGHGRVRPSVQFFSDHAPTPPEPLVNFSRDLVPVSEI